MRATTSRWWRRKHHAPEAWTWRKPLPRGPVAFDLSMCTRAALVPVRVQERRTLPPRR